MNAFHADMFTPKSSAMEYITALMRYVWAAAELGSEARLIAMKTVAQITHILLMKWNG